MHGRIKIEYEWERVDGKNIKKYDKALLHDFAISMITREMMEGKTKGTLAVVIIPEEDDTKVKYTGWWDCTIRKS